jgi:hypothetical protein
MVWGVSTGLKVEDPFLFRGLEILWGAGGLEGIGGQVAAWIEVAAFFEEAAGVGGPSQMTDFESLIAEANPIAGVAPFFLTAPTIRGGGPRMDQQGGCLTGGVVGFGIADPSLVQVARKHQVGPTAAQNLDHFGRPEKDPLGVKSRRRDQLLMNYDYPGFGGRCGLQALGEQAETLAGHPTVLHREIPGSIDPDDHHFIVFEDGFRVFGEMSTVGPIGCQEAFPNAVHWDIVVARDGKSRNRYTIDKGAGVLEFTHLGALGEIARDHQQVRCPESDEVVDADHHFREVMGAKVNV